jgi:uncharacterized damage-inducible protein DinB
VITSETAQFLIDYTAWASRLMVEAAGRLSPEELTRDFSTADKSVLGTLAHIYGADRAWLARVEGAPQSWLTESDYQLAVLEKDWPVIHERWGLWAGRLDDAALASELAYTDLKGNPHRQPLWQVVMHVVNHGSHHRGQVSGFLRAMGHTPPGLDMTRYYRLGAAGRAR